jgi:Mg2+ and Co2+ transporter CorA
MRFATRDLDEELVHLERTPGQILNEFLERAEGGGQIGELDAPSFVAAIGEWVIASYLRAFKAVETGLEELDAKIISETPRRDVSDELSKLVDVRRRIGTLRRRPAPRSWLFWIVIVMMLLIAALVLATARVREWI